MSVTTTVASIAGAAGAWKLTTFDRCTWAAHGMTWGTFKPFAFSAMLPRLALADSPEALTFEAVLPPEGEQTSWQQDFMRAHAQGLLRGLSPGFNVLPKSMNPQAEAEAANPAIPGTTIRTIAAALLGEFSAVTRAAYPDTILEARDDETRHFWQLNREALRWL